MAPDGQKAYKATITQKSWVQTTLSAAFFQPQASSSSSPKPHLITIPGPSTQQSLNLFPERRRRRRRRRQLPSPTPPPALQPPPQPSTLSSPALTRTASETLSLTPALLRALPQQNFQTTHKHLYPDTLHSLDHYPHLHPRLPPAVVAVVNADTLDTALARFPPRATDRRPPLVLNLANARVPGGGWRRGAMAQEEALFYRTTLCAALSPSLYPLRADELLYTPKTLVVRASAAAGHALLDVSRPEALPVVSVVSVAAVRDPETMLVQRDGRVVEVYRHGRDREAMRRKCRAVLRVAARYKHRRIVLGALGCGAFGNPRREVVRLWSEVLAEREFAGWWEGVVFAVLEEGGSKGGDGNFGVFWRGVGGREV